jgi:hypothetical protein
MAYTTEQWERARGYYEAGLSLREISAKTHIDYSRICRMAKKQQWEHGKNLDYIKAKETVAQQMATIGAESPQVLLCADEVANDRIKLITLINAATVDNIKIAHAKIKTGQYKETILEDSGAERTMTRDLTVKDHKDFQDLLDKATYTVGINKRSNDTEDRKIKQIQDNNDDSVVINILPVSVREIE